MGVQGEDRRYGRLVRQDPAWLYRGFGGSLATRRLQVWQTGPGRLVAIVTEGPDDSGTSLTNAAEAVIAQLDAEYPGQHVEVIEHYTPRPPAWSEPVYQRWTLIATGPGPTDGQTIELPPAAETIPTATWHRVSLDTRGSATWQALSPADVARTLHLAPGDAGKVGA